MVRSFCSPPPSRIVLGGYDGSLAGLSLEADETSALTLALKFAYSPHVSAVRSLALKSSLLASGGVDETVRIYDLGKGVEVGTLQHHRGTINSLQFVKDSRRNVLFSCSDDASICVWRCSDWTCLKQLRAHNAPVIGMAVHQSARVALSVSKDRSLCMWNLPKGKVAFSCKTKGAVPTCVRWSPGGEAYSLTCGNRVTLFNVGGKSTNEMNHEYPVLCNHFIDNNTMATGGEEKNVRIWDLRDASTGKVAFKHDKRVRSLGVIDGLLISADSGGGLKIWDVRMEGKPRIETAIADGQLRLTCMVSGLQERPNRADDEEKDIVPQASTNAGENPQALSPRKRGDRQLNETPSKPLGTASQRKRKKRKLMKATQ